MFEKILERQTKPLNSITVDHNGQSVSIGGAVTDVREITTRNGQKMAFVKVEDRYAEIEVVLFPASYQKTAGLWERDRVVLVNGKVSTRDRNGNGSGEVKIMAESAKDIAAAHTGPGTSGSAGAKPASERLYIRLQDTNDEKTLLSLKETIDSHKGSTEVVLVLGEASSKQAIKLPGGIDTGSPGLTKLRDIVGVDNLVIR
jgi:DNA polymerase-3 subunit alpha